MQTRPRGEQLRFESTRTGSHVIDDYMEAVEKGDRTLPDLLSDIFDDVSGALRDDLWEFRIEPTTQQLQVRSGGITKPWKNVPNGYIFRQRGAWAPSTAYEILDAVTRNGAYYICKIKHTSTGTFDASKFIVALDFAPATLLADIKTVDGPGSGLDADLLDGKHASAFGEKATDNTWTGNNTFTMPVKYDAGGSGYVAFTNPSGTPGISGFAGTLRRDIRLTADGVEIGISASGAQPSIQHRLTATGHIINGGTVWHSGNDGPNSGLDADTVDGKHASDFGEKAANNTWTGANTFNGNVTVNATLAGDRVRADTAGNAGTPAISFAGDPNTGLYNTAADAIAVSAGGTDIARFDSAGLTVVVGATSGPRVLATAAGTATAPALSFSGDDNTGFYNISPDVLAISTGGAERLRVTADGKVGIGTPSPISDLHVVGAVIRVERQADDGVPSYLVLHKSRPGGGNIGPSAVIGQLEAKAIVGGADTSYGRLRWTATDLNGNANVALANGGGQNLIAVSPTGVTTFTANETGGGVLPIQELYNSGVLRVKTRWNGITEWHLNSGSGEVGSIAISTPAGDPGIVMSNPDGSSTATIVFSNHNSLSFSAAGAERFRVDSSGATVTSGSLKVGSSTVWHSGNDGPGSGLNADTVDGQHASAFATSDHTHSQYSLTSHTHSQYSLTSHTHSGLIKQFTSSAITISSGLSYSVAHGLGAMPLMAQGFLDCISAELGYGVGIRVPLEYLTCGQEEHFAAATLLYNSSNVAVVMANTTQFFLKRRDTSIGNVAQIDLSKWRLYLRVISF